MSTHPEDERASIRPEDERVSLHPETGGMSIRPEAEGVGSHPETGGMSIRPETPGDHGRVFAIHAAAFERSNEADLVEALRAAAHPTLSLVAERDGRVVGHVLLSPVALDPPASGASLAGLAPVGVEPAGQGRGVGSALVRAALERAPALGWQAVFLVGSPEWYPRFGFVAAAPLGFTYGDPAIDPALQACALRPGALAGLGGRVCFHRAFVETGCG